MMSTDYAEHRSFIKFCVISGRRLGRQKMLEIAKVMSPVCQALIFKWHKCFSVGRECTEYDKVREENQP